MIGWISPPAHPLAGDMLRNASFEFQDVCTSPEQGCSAQISFGGALIKEYINQKLVKRSYFSNTETCCNPHYE